VDILSKTSRDWRRDAAGRAGTSAWAMGAFPYFAIGALGCGLWWSCRTSPADLPVWAPWDFSWLQYLAAALALWWYFLGLARTAPAERAPVWRRVAFVLGVGLLYAVLQTRIEYFTQHMFFLNRAQHIVMHHLGPFLIALAVPGPAFAEGMPAPLLAVARSRPVRAAIDFLQQPVLAAFLFVGLVYFWLIPAVNFRAMLDPRLYALMNWSMVLDGLLFWSLVLDPRPSPPARVSWLGRAALAVLVMFPQIALGALISFAGRDLYPFYDYCGRLLPSIGALTDQMIGGVIIWIPPAMMSVVALLLVLAGVRANEEESEDDSREDVRAMAIAARRWTGG
jgi:putative membrane protein